jgi:cation:H+ antiporter
VLDSLLLLAGAAFLYFGAEWLVSGTSSLALSLRIPQLVVGLTVVAYGTSAPELIVSIQAGLSGHGDIALGNVIGSNIVNLGLILGVAALIRPARVDAVLQRRELPVLVASAAAVPLVLWDGRLSPVEGTLLLLGAITYTTWMIVAARGTPAVHEAERGASVTAAAADVAGGPATHGPGRLLLVASTGLLVLLLGGHLFVSSATSLARSWGMSERVLGLTIVAIGTSLPELATSCIAAMRGHSDIAVGNVVGSNIFNVLLCLGAAGLSGSVRANPRDLLVDLGAFAGLTLIGAISIRSARTIRRWEGALLLAAYVGFLAYLIVR